MTMEAFSLGEFELIARLSQGLATHQNVIEGIGDDCAVLDLGGDKQLLATCDSQVEDVHFTLQTSSPEQIGRKALSVNLSDIASMGGEPRYALISLIVPMNISVDVLDGIYAGLRQEAEKYSTVVVGGNIASSGKVRQLTIDITLLGTVESGRALLRSGAHAGDILCITGSLGEAAAGLYTLFYPHRSYPPDALEVVRSRQRTPRPRVPEGRVLGQFGPSIVTAMIDISDGLSGDLNHLCDRSHVGARVELARLPLSEALHTIASVASFDPLHWALHGGEDYELLFTVAPGHEEEVINAVQTVTGTPVTRIGMLCDPAEGQVLIYPDGHEEQLVIKSWDHFNSMSQESY